MEMFLKFYIYLHLSSVFSEPLALLLIAANHGAAFTLLDQLKK